MRIQQKLFQKIANNLNWDPILVLMLVQNGPEMGPTLHIVHKLQQLPLISQHIQSDANRTATVQQNSENP